MQIRGALGTFSSFGLRAPFRWVISLSLLLLPAISLGQFCPGCIQNSASPQAATFNLTQGATIQGLLSVTSATVHQLNVGIFSAASFAGDGSSLTNLNASALSSGFINPDLVVGPYPGITQVGTLSAGEWNGSPVPTQFGGTGQNFAFVSTGSILYFSSVGVIGSLLPGPPQALMQTNGNAAPVWTLAPAVSGANLYNIPANRLTGNLPSSVAVSSNSIANVAGASVLGNISGNASGITGTIPQSQVSSGTWPSNYPASSITVTGVSPGTYGNGSYSAQIVVRTDGRLSSATQLPITVGASSVTSGTFPLTVTLPLPDLASGILPTSVPASSITATGVSPGVYGGSGYLPSIRVGVDGRITSATQYAAPGLSTSTARTDTAQGWNAPQTFGSSITINSTLGVTGGITGNLTGNVTGNASGSAGTVPASGVDAGALGTGVTISTANVLPGFNGASELIQATAAGYFPALNGSLITHLSTSAVTALPASAITSGALSPTVTVSTVNVLPGFNSANELVQLNGSGALPAISGANLTNLPIGNKFGFLTATNQTLGVGTFSFGYTNAAVTISSMSIIITTSGSGGGSGTVWACCYGGNCVSVTSSQGAAVGSSYTGNGSISVPAGGQIVLQMTSTGETFTPTVNAICAYQ